MNRTIAIALSIALAHIAIASHQTAEILIFKGVEYGTPVHPLETRKELQKFKFDHGNSGNVRGYQGKWEVKDNRLFLIAIEGGVEVENQKWEEASLMRLFPASIKDGRVDADWFSGTIYAPGHRWGEGLPDSTRDEQIAKATLVLKVTNGSVAVIKYETPMHRAAQHGNTSVLKVLLAQKEDVDTKDKDGKTPLHWAAAGGHKEVVELLLANKAEANIKCYDGTTPMDCAVQAGHKEVAELLHANGRQE